MPTLLDLLIPQLKTAEGLRLKAYKDTVGVWTIGYGHTAGVKEGDTITGADAENMLRIDAQSAVNDTFRTWPWVTDLDLPRQVALVNMCYNLGANRLGQFKKMLNALRYQDWGTAAGEAQRSLWASQVGARAQQIARTFRTGI